MNNQNFLEQFKQSSPVVKFAVVSLVLMWSLVLMVIMIAAILLFGRPSQAEQPTSGSLPPVIYLAPATGSAGSSITVQGENWTPGSTVLIYLSPGEPASYALTSTMADETGRFTATLVVPTEPRWLTPGTATVIARAQNSQLSAQATLAIAAPPGQPTPTPTQTTSPTPVPAPTATPLPQAPTATPLPALPLAIATTNLNVRSGPGTAYPVLGLLQTGQSAEITGRSFDGEWWQIKFLGVPGERGWLAASYTNAQNTANVPVVQGQPLPPAPTPTPTPVVITDWQGEYYNNPNLSGNPVLVRNDVAINFDWGAGSPAAGLSPDNFSVRWTRQMSLPPGLYRFYLTVDDGVRLWIDGNLVIDQWHDSPSASYVADVRLGQGSHNFRVEYYNRHGGAQINLSWERLNEQPHQRPEAVPGGPYSINEGGSIILDGSRSIAFDGAHLVKYEWDLNYNGYNFTTDATGQHPLATYPGGPAAYSIALRVTDSRGSTSQIATTQVRVRNVVLRVKAGGPYAGQVGQPVNFVGTVNGAGPNDQVHLFYHWDFGDGATANGLVASHSYNQAGNYTARLTVTDQTGVRGSDTAVVQISAVNQAPVAVISGPDSGQVGENLNFSGANSYDSNGTIASFTWNFGDGTTGNGVDVSHSYSQPGNYQVTLTVIDESGSIGTSAFNLQINEIAQQPPLARLSGPTEGAAGESLTFDGSSSSDSNGSIISFAWDFGDGTVESGMLPTLSHSYTQPGLYTVTLTVTDDSNLSDTVTEQVIIN